MTLNEALALIKDRKGHGRSQIHYLVCGFQPLHLATFFNAHVSERFSGDHVELLTGLYGDLIGNLAKASESAATAAAVVIEWPDIDPRLGLRSSGGWSEASKEDMLRTAGGRCLQIAAAVEKLALRRPVAVAAPGLPLPPIGTTIRAQSSVLELELARELDGLLLRLARTNGIRVVDRSHLEQLSPGSSRLDAKMEFLAGFPYSISHASALARCLAEVLYPRAPKKGLITDLDETLWSGIVGEVGPEAVTWHLESHTQTHALYQQMLGHLAGTGVLVGVSSKNELTVVKTALARTDLLVAADALFPVVADWAPKSRAVGEILHTWNTGANDVVFIDDNLMELSEVQQAYPQITCLHFPKNDPGKLWSLLGELRDLFGKPVLLEEDKLRRDSIRTASRISDSGVESTSPEFLRGLQGNITLDYRKNPADQRPLQLINKTNQFNLNGARLTEGDWLRYLERDDQMLITVSYQDKFGPLGKIAVLLASQQERSVRVEHWVMSCRSFSRKIEHHTLDSLFQRTQADAIEFAFHPTDRNQPLQEFFLSMGVESGTGRLGHAQFIQNVGELPHQTSEIG